MRGGGRKIYRQKGTGNARHHGRRAPQFTHGGVVFAPKPRDYRISVPKKVRRLAMKSALSCKVSDAELVVVDKIEPVSYTHLLIEFGETEQIFSNPRDKRTEDYITGRFG